MKHVREEVPDVQRLRPGISAATAAVVDRAVTKDLTRRYPDAAEHGRRPRGGARDRGRPHGPGDRRGDERAAHAPRAHPAAAAVAHAPPRALGRCSLVLLAAIVAIVLTLAAGETHRGAGQPPDINAHAGLEPVPLGQTAAHDYNPFGTGPENRDLIGNVVDGDPSTTWSTEQYYDGTLRKSGGLGLGVYLDAAPRVLAKALEIQTPTPGFAVQVYVADHIDLELPYGSSTPLAARGWQGPVGASADVHDGERIPLALAGQPHRYYLVWLTTLPPHAESATIAELTLFK